MVDTSKQAPFDCLFPDGALSEKEIKEARAGDAMWTAEHLYPVLPWSCIVLEAVPEAKVQVPRAAPSC